MSKKDIIENKSPKTELDCLRAIELNVSNLCNLKCEYCPYSLNLKRESPNFMDISVVEELKKQLDDIHFDGVITISGFGEPSYNKELLSFVNHLKDYKTIVITNGLLRDDSYWKEIKKYATINVSVHNEFYYQYLKEKFLDCELRKCYNEEFKLDVFSRGGLLNKESKEGIRSFPFYKVMLDTDGSYLQCSGDWSRESKTNYTIKEVTIKEHFLNRLETVRESMLNGRKNIPCCKNCDIDGTKIGMKFVRFYEKRI